MNLTLSFNGNETRADVEKAFAAALLFTGNAGGFEQKVTVAVDPAITIEGAKPDEYLEGIANRNAPADDGTWPKTVNGVLVDKTGLPRDTRIHADGENHMNKDGTWRARRGVDAAFKAVVEAELRALMAAPPAAPAAEEVEEEVGQVETPPAPPSPPSPPTPPAASAPPAPPAVAAATPPAPPANGATLSERAAAGDASAIGESFGTLMSWVTYHTSKSNLLTSEEVNAVLQGAGLVDTTTGAGKLTLLITNKGKLPEVRDALVAIVAEKQG